jgi:hypothetical protein
MGSPKRFGEPALFPLGTIFQYVPIFAPSSKVSLTLADLPLRGDPAMSISVQSIQPVNTHAGTQETDQPPKQTTTQDVTPQDKVTISESAKQALAKKTTPAP